MKVKYFSGSTELVYIRPMKNDLFASRFDVRGVRYDGYSRLVGYAIGATNDGHELPVTRKIEYKSNPSLHRCDARCRNAKGHSCECSCGGQFHGFGDSGMFQAAA